MSISSIWIRGLAQGLAYGLAVTGVETWFMAVRLMRMNLPGFVRMPAESAATVLCFTVFLGLVLTPLLRLPAGGLVHLLAVAAAWIALSFASGTEGDFFFMLTVAPPLAGLVLTLVGYALARRRPTLAWTLGALVLISALGFQFVRSVQTHVEGTNLAARVPAPRGAPDVVIVVLDTVRAESMSTYGYQRQTTPAFDALARDGALFLDATSPSNWSLPSHSSLFTGLFLSVHGAHQENHHLRADVPTLGGLLTDAGWESGCFTANPWISDAMGTTRGFDYKDEAWRSGGAGRSISSAGRVRDLLGFGAHDKGGAAVADGFARWLGDRPTDGRPYYAFLNFVEAHFPYHQLPEEYLTKYSDLPRGQLRQISMALFADQFGTSSLDPEAALQPAIDMYDGGIFYSDYLLGLVVDALRARGTLDSTILVVLADHGELVGEHGGWGHGGSLYEEDIRVPLLVRYPPRVPAARIAQPVSTVGVMASVLELVRVPTPTGLHVGSLLPALEGRPAGAPLLSERFSRADSRPRDPFSGVRIRSYRSGDWKLVETTRPERFLFYLASPEGEDRNMANARPDELARMVAELEDWKAALGLPDLDAPLAAEGVAPELDDEARERLKALGYIE